MKHIWLAFIMVVVIFALVSCKTLISGGDIAIEPSKVLYWTVDVRYGDYMQTKAKEWNELHPQSPIELEVKVFRSDEINDKLKSALQSGIISTRMQAPDLVDIDYSKLPIYTSQSYCLLYSLDNQLSQYLPEWSEASEFDPYCYRELCFALPYQNDEMVMYYNETLLSKAGISSEEIHTWDDFIACGKEFYDKTGLPLFSIDTDYYQVFLTLCTQMNMKFIDDASDDSGYEAALNFMERLIEENIAIVMPGGRSDSSTFLKAFANGEVGAVLTGASQKENITEALKNQSCSTGSIPQFSAPEADKVWLPGYATAVTTYCEDFIIMKEFLVFSRLSDGGGMSELCRSDYTSHTMLPNASAVSAYIDAYPYALMKRVLEE